MEPLSNKKRPCVMIVDRDMDFGIKLADWLATHGYQAVLVRSAEAAIDECPNLQPQAIFIGLGHAEPTASLNLRRLFRAIETACPRVPMVTMGHRVIGNLIQVVTGGGIRHVLVHPFECMHIGRLLQAELNRSTASLTSPATESDPPDGCAIEPRSYTRTVHSEAATWIR